MQYNLLLLLASLSLVNLSSCRSEDGNMRYKFPTVGISVLIRNKAHALPYFFTCLRNLDYPKDRLYIWIYSDFNEDNSIEVIHKWAERYSTEYNNVYISANSSSGSLHVDEARSTQWTSEHFRHVISLREKAFEFSRKMWTDYVFMIDADVFLTNPLTLRNLVSKELDAVAPMLLSDGLYSNFWCGMTERYYYMRTDDYKPIQSREDIGCFQVPMIHTAVLINMRTVASNKLTYDPKKIKNYSGPHDDIIAFAVNAKINDITLNICNDEFYGYIPVPLEDNDELAVDYEQLLNLKLLAISRGDPLPLEPYMEADIQYPVPWKFGCNEIFMINLDRRNERRKLMEMSFKELGLDVTHFSAVDGKTLDMRNLKDIKLMPNYEDPYHKRPMKAGEVGCFLSHFYIWEKIVNQKIGITLILEDDIRFVSYFRNRFLQLMREIEHLDWDLVYIGRKILLDDEEQFVTEHTTKPLYSYWTLGYLISERGARKLLDAKPLDNVLPVDEFLPIMFDQHPNDTWKAHFPVRNLQAYSAAPLLVHPTHYTGQDGYISDTEDSHVLENHVHRHLTNELTNGENLEKDPIIVTACDNALNENSRDCAAGEVCRTLGEQYCVLSECVSAVNCALDRVSAAAARPVLPCAAQRFALELCYSAHALQPLNCQHLVTELVECARKHALHEQKQTEPQCAAVL